MKFSASMISTWSKCALQAKFGYVEKLPQLQNAAASFGTCVHDALEQYNADGDIQAAVNRFLLTWEHPEMLDRAPDIWPKRMTYSGLRETGVKILLDYHEGVVWSNREVIGAEHKFAVPFGDHVLSGIVDLIEYIPKQPSGTLKIVDYKTSGYRPNYNSLYLNIQFSIYMYASLQPEFWMGYDDGTGKYPGMANGEELFDRFKDVKRQAIWSHLRTNKEFDCGPRDDMDFMRLYRCCEEIRRALEHEVFVPNISGDTCTLCAFTDSCGAFIPPIVAEGQLS